MASQLIAETPVARPAAVREARGVPRWIAVGRAAFVLTLLFFVLMALFAPC